MRLRHLKQIAKRKLTASEAESESIRDVKTSSEVQSLDIQDSFKDHEECFSTDYVRGCCGYSVSKSDTYKLCLYRS